MPERLSHQKLINQYPDLAGYFPANEVAQLLGNKRLRSAEEKIEMFGGVTQVSNNIHRARERSSEVPYIVLLACDRDPMISFEIIRFAYIATEGKYLLAISPLYSTIRDFLKEGFLNSVAGVTFIHRSKTGDYMVKPNNTGYSITGGRAIGKRAELLNPQEKQTPRISPQPQPI